MKTNTQKGRRPIPPPLYVLLEIKKTGKCVERPPPPHQENFIESV